MCVRVVYCIIIIVRHVCVYLCMYRSTRHSIGYFSTLNRGFYSCKYLVCMYFARVSPTTLFSCVVVHPSWLRYV